MTALPIAQTILPAGHWSGQARACTLDYAARFLRRKKLTTDDGQEFVVDLEHTTSLNHGDALALNDGTLIEIRAASEAVLKVTGASLAQLAWHIGNRHTPCQIATDHVLIQDDPVIAHMLDHLGAKIEKLDAPFTPEGGAYGFGRTHSHDHGHTHHV